MKYNKNNQWKLAKIGKYVVSISVATTLFINYMNTHYQFSSANTHKTVVKNNKLNNYVVKSNDTIDKIAKKFNVKTKYLINKFNIKHSNVLFVGKKLINQNTAYINYHKKQYFSKHVKYNVINNKIYIIDSNEKINVKSNKKAVKSSAPKSNVVNSNASQSTVSNQEVSKSSTSNSSQSSSTSLTSSNSATPNEASNSITANYTSSNNEIYELNNRMNDDLDSSEAASSETVAKSIADSQAASQSTANSEAASESTANSIAISESIANSIATSESYAKSTATSLANSESVANSIAASLSASKSAASSQIASENYANSIAASQASSQANITKILNNVNASQSAYQSFSAEQQSIAASSNALFFNNYDNQITSATIDKARYNPGDIVKFNINLHNNANNQTASQVQINFYKDNQRISSIASSFTLTNNADKQINMNWTTPNQDYQGYRAEIVVNGKIQKVLAVDVSSNINKFPRYGAITSFKPNTDNSQILNDMKNWNINSLEYYDAYQTPQTPINYDNPTSDWQQDWAVWLSQQDKTKSGQVIKNTVDQAHQLGIDSMFYNMIYAITGNANNKDYLKSIGVKPEWLLYHADGDQKDQLFQFPMANYIKDKNDPNYIKATQTYLDITNPEVVDWIVSRMYPVLKDLNFDGWHGDTIGNNDLMYSKNADGSIKNEYHVADKLGEFANMVKERLHDKKFIINTVSNVGQDNVAKSNSDIDYSEMWTGNYINVVDAIKRVYEESGKSLIIPGYLQSKYAATHQGSDFNENAVLLFDAMVDSAGGSRIEVVDGQHLLVGEYFPDKSLNVSDNLKQKMQNYQTFITAYENLLRDGQKDNYNGINVYDNNGNNVRSDNATPNSVYAYSRSSNNSETIQLVNLLGVSSSDWQDNDNTKQKPNTLNNFHVSYYPSQKYQPGQNNEVHHIYLASPDGDNNNQSIEVPFTWKHDQYGYYLDITIPSLQYWDMLYLK